MFRRYSKAIGAVVLFFFTWTSGGVFSIAYAAQDAVKKGKVKEQQKKVQGPEERFAKATEDLQETLFAPKVDIETKKQRLKSAKTEIEALDPEIRKQFAATEQKLKDAKLSPAILERHRKFVKHYDDNLNELKGNIERVEKAKDNAETETELRKVHEHLKRVKAPSSHQKLDPNNLSHRQRTLQKREPRTKKENFDKDLKKDKRAWQNQKRIQVASAGSLAGLLVSNSVNAIQLPTSDDLAETPDVQLTPEIRAKALELGNNPVKIYEWVRNNIDYVPTWGSIQGAQMTMLTKQGNAFDNASLLIALLRAAGIHARYNTGSIVLPIDKVMNWVGNFTDPMSALDFMSSGGVPTTGLTEGGKITHARLEHVWVEAFINYIPSRGAKHFNGKGDTWIKLDPSYKQYIFTQGINANSTFQLISTARAGNVLDTKKIEKKEYPYLLGTLPYRTAIKGSTFTNIPDTLRHKLTFNIQKDVSDTTSLAITKSLPELAGKKITISYSPATSDDLAVINSYLPQPHADGTPLEPGELPQSLPGYLINLVPELRINGLVVATGSPVPLGTIETFKMTFFEPNVDDSIITNTITAGVYAAIGLNLGKIGQQQQNDLKAKFAATKTKLINKELTGLTKDDLLGDLLFSAALTYLSSLSSLNSTLAISNEVNVITLPSETIFTTKLNISSLWGTPHSVAPGGLYMDADRLLYVVKAKDGTAEKTKQFMQVSGSSSSELENVVPEQLFSTPDNPVEGISTVKALSIATEQNIPIFTIAQQNISTILPQLQLNQDVIADIQNAVAAGKIVTAPKNNINYQGWNGCGYIIANPETGAAAYLISAGLSGAVVIAYTHMYLVIAAFVDCELQILSDFWGSAYNEYNPFLCNDTDSSHECPCGRWYGYGADFQAHILYGGNISLMKYVCLSKSSKTCTAASACFTMGPDADGGINGTVCAVRNSYNITDFPNTMNITVGTFRVGPGGGFGFDENLKMFCGSIGYGFGAGLKANLLCKTKYLDCENN